MSCAKQGDTVRVHYTGKLENGQVFDSSRERHPLELTLGEGRVIAGFERALDGMTPGESKSVHVPMGEAFGDRRVEKVLVLQRSALAQNVDPQVGEQVQLQAPGGSAIPAVVTETSQSTVTVDANHPLAGQDLFLDIELLEIVKSGSGTE